MKTAVASRQARPSRTDKNGRLSHAGKKIWRSRYLYLLLLPTFVCRLFAGRFRREP